MTRATTFNAALLVSAALAVTACGTPNTRPEAATAYPSPSNVSYVSYGVVQSVELVRVAEPGRSDLGIGTVAGAIVGGIVGNQVGAGRGNTAATVAGAAGGAYAGHQLEKRDGATSEAYKITIRMDDGSFMTTTQSTNANLRAGDRVQVENGVIRRY